MDDDNDDDNNYDDKEFNQHDDTLIDLPLEALSVSLIEDSDEDDDNDDDESEAGDFSAARSARRQEDSHRNDSSKGEHALDGQSDSSPLCLVKSDTLESDESEASSVYSEFQPFRHSLGLSLDSCTGGGACDPSEGDRVENPRLVAQLNLAPSDAETKPSESQLNLAPSDTETKSPESQLNLAPSDAETKPSDSQLNLAPSAAETKPSESQLNLAPSDAETKPPESQLNLAPSDAETKPPDSHLNLAPSDAESKPSEHSQSLQQEVQRHRSTHPTSLCTENQDSTSVGLENNHSVHNSQLAETVNNLVTPEDNPSTSDSPGIENNEDIISLVADNCHSTDNSPLEGNQERSPESVISEVTESATSKSLPETVDRFQIAQDDVPDSENKEEDSSAVSENKPPARDTINLEGGDEGIPAAITDIVPSLSIEDCTCVQSEDSSSRDTQEETVIRKRRVDRDKAPSRPLSDVSDVQIESVWFVQGPKLEENVGCSDQTTDGEQPEATLEEETRKCTALDLEQNLEETRASEGDTSRNSDDANNVSEQQECEDNDNKVSEQQECEDNDNNVSEQQECEDSSNNNMGENSRLAEKLKQFQSQAKEESTENRTTVNPLDLADLDKQRRRNLIFDEERFEETFLKCLICREVYNETDKLPKMLHCHHTFCMDCLYQMYRVEGEFRQSLTSVFRGMPMTVKIQCPTCREGIIISEAELRRLPNDHTIMELLSFVTVTGKSDISYCPKHQMQPLNFFCEPCIMPVCCDCTVLDHKESKGHKVVNVDEAMAKYTPILEQTLSDIRTEKASLAEKRDSIKGAQNDLDRVQTGITDQIRLVFDAIREVLDERERELHDVAESEVDRKRSILDEHLKTLSDRELDLNVEFNSLHQAKDDKDLSLIFTGHKSARDLLVKKVHVPTNSTQGFSITFQYSSRSDSVIKQQVANLGDIIFHSS